MNNKQGITVSYCVNVCKVREEKRQSLTTVLLRTPITQMISFNQDFRCSYAAFYHLEKI